MAMTVEPAIERIAILGAMGDPATRYLLPALTHLLAGDSLSSEFSIAAIGRRELDQEEYRARTREGMASGRAALHDADHERSEDGASARDLNHLLHQTFPETHVFRIDHSEEGVDPARNTETFVDLPHLAFGQQGDPRQNTLRLELAPDRIVLGLSINGPGDPFDLEPVDLEVSFARQSPPAYGRLLLDVIRGDATLAIRDDEIEECWRIVEPSLQSWSAGASPLLEIRLAPMVLRTAE